MIGTRPATPLSWPATRAGDSPMDGPMNLTLRNQGQTPACVDSNPALMGILPPMSLQVLSRNDRGVSFLGRCGAFRLERQLGQMSPCQVRTNTTERAGYYGHYPENFGATASDMNPARDQRHESN